RPTSRSCARRGGGTSPRRSGVSRSSIGSRRRDRRGRLEEGDAHRLVQLRTRKRPGKCTEGARTGNRRWSRPESPAKSSVIEAEGGRFELTQARTGRMPKTLETVA